MGYCIGADEHDAAAQLSKYFQVGMLDFCSGLTTAQVQEAMAHTSMITDIMVGLHGAGLANIAFLPDRSARRSLYNTYKLYMETNCFPNNLTQH